MVTVCDPMYGSDLEKDLISIKSVNSMPLPKVKKNA